MIMMIIIIIIITTIIMVTRPTVDRVKPGITFLRLYGRVEQTKATIIRVSKLAVIRVKS